MSARTPSAARALTQGTDLRRGVGRRANPQRLYRAAEACDELVGDRRVHVEAVGRGAGLPAAAELRDHRALDRRGDVGVGGDDERRVAAEFHACVEHPVRGLLEQHAPDAGGPGEGDLAHAIVGSQVLTPRRSRPWSARRSRLRPARRPLRAVGDASAVSGVSAAGLSTTVHPAARAGAILRVAMAAGKFHGVTSAATADRSVRDDGAGAAGQGSTPYAPSVRTASSLNQRKNSAA